MSLSPQLWLEHIEAWKQTTQTQADYCREHGISPYQFSYWKRKQQNQSSGVHQKVTSGFAVAQIETVTTMHHGFSVTLPDGTRFDDIHASNVHIAAQLMETLR